MAVKILIADPSTPWLKEAAQFFQSHFYEVRVANSGKRAQLEIYNHRFLAIILNLELQDHSATNVLNYIKSSQPSLKVILIMPEEASLTKNGLTVKALEKQGITEIFMAPYALPKLKEAVEGYQDFAKVVSNKPTQEGQREEVEMEVEDHKFTSIKMDEFVSGKAVQFNIFIRLDSGRYVKILHAGDSFSQERIDKYKNEKHITHLYFLTEERKKFIRLGNFIAEKTAANPNVGLGTKIVGIKNVGQKLVEEMYFDGVKPQILEQGKEYCNNLYQILYNNNGIQAILREYEEFDPSAFSHSFLVSLFSTMLVKQFEWDSKIVSETIGMASLLHDIGFIRLPKALVGKRPHEMNEEEFKQYKQHPELGAELLANNNLISAMVKQVIIQHHECNNGKGFPFGLKGGKILNMSKIIFLVDDFVHFMVENTMTPPRALKGLLCNPDSIQRYGSSILEHFIKIFIEPEKLAKMAKMKSD